MIVDAILTGLYGAIAAIAFCAAAFVVWLAIICLCGVFDWIKGEIHALRNKKRF